MSSVAILQDGLHCNRINVLVSSSREYNLNRNLIKLFLESFRQYIDGLADFTIDLDYAQTSPFASLIHVEAASWWSSVKFLKPTSLTLVGGSALGYFCKGDTVDVALELPGSIFYPKDYLNYRYLNKRNAYMYHLYRELCNGDQPALQIDEGLVKPQISLSTDGCKQNIILHYNIDKTVALKLRLIACIPCDLFKIRSLASDRNCIRNPSDNTNGTGDINSTPTPRYNSCIIEDLLMLSLQSELEKLACKYDHLDSAVILFKKWCGIRKCLDSKDYNVGISGFVGFVIGAHVCSCMQLPSCVDGFTIFRAMLRFISTFKSGSKVNFRGSNIVKGENAFLARLFLFEHLNILYKTSLIWDEMVHHAAESITTLKSDCPYMYTRLFEVEYLPICCFDSCLVFDSSVHSPFRPLSLVPNLLPLSHYWWMGFTFEEYLAFLVKQVLQYGLGDALGRCLFRKAHDVSHAGHRLFVFLCYNETAFNSLRLGPLSNDQLEVAKFREFWGSIAETRRFPDGSIYEVAEIVHNFANTRHMELVDKTSTCHSLYSFLVNTLITRFFSQKFEIKVANTLAEPGLDIVIHQLSPSPDASSCQCMIIHPPFVLQLHSTDAYIRGLIEAYNILNRLLRGLKRIPLTVLNVHWADEAFAYSRGQIVPHALHHVILVFESSSAWPNDPVGIQHIKVAFCNSIYKELLTSKSGVSPMVKVSSLGNLTVQLNGYSFFLHLTFPKEVRRIEKIAQSLSSDTAPIEKLDTKTVDSIHQIYLAPKYTEYLRNVALKNPSYSNAVNLAKRWVASEFVPNADFIAEMICAFVYTNSHLMYGIPTSASVGFCKFLFILAHFDWNSRPLVVEFDEPWPDFPLELLDKRGLALQTSVPLPYLWIATRLDVYCRLAKMPCDALCVRLTFAARNMLMRMHVLGPFAPRLVDREQSTIKLSQFHMKISLEDSFKRDLNQHETRQLQHANQMLINGIHAQISEIGYIAYNTYYFNGALASSKNVVQQHTPNGTCQNPGICLRFDSRALLPSSNANNISTTPKTLVDPQRHINFLTKRSNRLVSYTIFDFEALVLLNFPMLLYNIRSIGGTSITCQFLMDELSN